MKQESAESPRSKRTAPGVPIVLPKMYPYPYEDEYHNEVARLIWANLSTYRKGNCNKLAAKKGFTTAQNRDRRWASHALLVTEIYFESKQYSSFHAWLASLPTIFERITGRLGI